MCDYSFLKRFYGFLDMRQFLYYAMCPMYSQVRAMWINIFDQT